MKYVVIRVFSKSQKKNLALIHINTFFFYSVPKNAASLFLPGGTQFQFRDHVFHSIMFQINHFINNRLSISLFIES